MHPLHTVVIIIRILAQTYKCLGHIVTNSLMLAGILLEVYENLVK